MTNYEKYTAVWERIRELENRGDEEKAESLFQRFKKSDIWKKVFN